MTEAVKQVHDWAKTQPYQSVAARHARTLAGEIDRLMAENDALRKRAEAGEVMRPADEWHEDHGPALWWNYPDDDDPFVGSPLWDDWKDRPFEPTYFTRITAKFPPETKEATP